MPNVLRSSLLNLAATVVSLVAGFAVSIITARLLGPEGSGTVAFAMWLVMAASAIGDLGMPQTVLRHAAASSDGDGWKPMVRTAFSRLSIAGMAIFLLATVYAGLQLLDGRIDAALLGAIGALLFVAYVLNAFSTAAARGRNRFGETATSTVTGCLAQIPLVFAGAWFFGATGALAGMIARYLPQALHLGRYVDFRLPARKENLTADMRTYGRSMWISDMIDIVALSRIEFLFLGFFLSVADIGYFAAAIVFAGLVGQLTMQLSPALLVGFAGEAGETAKDAGNRLYGKSLRMTALFIFPIGLGGAAIIPELLPLLFGESFRPAAWPAALLLAASALSGLAVVPWAYLAARGNGARLMQITLVSAIAAISLLLIAVPWAGVTGAAIVRTLTETLSLVLLLLTAKAAGAPALPSGALLKTALAALLCALGAYMTVIQLPGWSGVFAAITVGAAIYLLAIRLLSLLTANESELLADAIENRLPERSTSLLQSLIRLLAPSPR